MFACLGMPLNYVGSIPQARAEETRNSTYIKVKRQREDKMDFGCDLSLCFFFVMYVIKLMSFSKEQTLV